MNGKRILLALLLGVAVAASLGAQPSGSWHGGPGGRGCERQMAQAIGLTDAQKTALDALRKQTFESIHPIADQMRALRQQVQTALGGSSPDPTAIGNLEIQAQGLRTQIDGIVKSAEATFVASLTAAQQASYATFLTANPSCTAIPSHAGRGGPRSPR